MIEPAHPWLLLLLLLLLPWMRARRKRERSAAFLYSSVDLVRGITDLGRARRNLLAPSLRCLCLALCIVALARPRVGEGETTVRATGIDIVAALDLSGSMAAEDFRIEGKRVNRLEAARDRLATFIEGRRGDRIGLVAFAGRAYVASPLTLDHDFLLQNLDRLALDTIEDGTAIGSAMMAGLDRLRDLDSKSRILILMTDGQNNQGEVPPLTAAEVARTLEVKVYTIGVGTRGRAPMPRKDHLGRTRYIEVAVDIDEETLGEIAGRTEGRYWRADSADTLESIYEEIDRLEKTEVEVSRYQRYRELFPWFLLAALTVLLLEILLVHTLWRRLP